MNLRIEPVTGAAVAGVIDGLAQLRGQVFRDWPYLYEADPDYERRYLADYVSGDAVIVTAHSGNQLVGAATGMPLRQHVDNLSTALSGFFDDLNDVFYCAESVLVSEFRGQGVGHRFFDLREAYARQSGFTHSVFCAVTRPEAHPARPKDYRPLDGFWRARGYRRLEATAMLSWRDLGDREETEKPMIFWARTL